MIYTIKDSLDPLADYLKDDPVRPHIPHEQRFGANRQVYALTENQEVKAVVCTRLCSTIPSSEQELLEDNTDNPDTVVFYTIWSYKAGKGQELLIEAVKGIQRDYPSVTRFVTLSPKTEMARRFHLKNGAIIFRENIDTVNYEYLRNHEKSDTQ